MAKTNIRKQSPKQSRIIFLLECLIGITVFITLVITIILTIIAPKHGATNRYISKAPIFDIIKNTVNSPVADFDYEQPKRDDIIIYYKFGCKDCEEIYQELKSDVKGLENIHWISTESENGLKLLNDYPVEQVPMLVFVKDNYYIFADPCKVYQSDEDTTITYNPNALSSLLKERTSMKP